MEIVTLDYHGKPYRIYNPGEGRVGSKLSMGTAYELMLLEDVYDLGLSGSVVRCGGAHRQPHSLLRGGLRVQGVRLGAPRRIVETALRQSRVEPSTRGRGVRMGGGEPGHSRKIVEGDVDGVRPFPGGGDDETGTREIFRSTGSTTGLEVSDLAVVKIDVEGMEPEVLEGMTEHLKRCRPVIYCETHTRLAQERIRRVLEPLGYHREKILQMGSPQHRWDP